MENDNVITLDGKNYHLENLSIEETKELLKKLESKKNNIEEVLKKVLN